MANSKNQPPKKDNRAARKRREREESNAFKIGSQAPARGVPVGGLKKFETQS